MPQFDPRFVMMAPLQQVIHDKDDGTLLAAGVVTFYKDNDRTVLKPIYKLTLNPSNQYEYIELNNPLTLSSIGSFVDDDGNNYIPLLFPYDSTPSTSTNEVELYYITVQSSGLVDQFTVEHWPQSLPFGGDTSDANEADNQLSNPQFVQVLFTPDLTTNANIYTVTGTNAVTPVAPDWDLVTTGSGTVTVKWIEVVDTTAPSNPPYALDIQGGGSLTVLQLRQRLVNSPRLFAGGFVSGAFVVNSQDGSDHPLTLVYTPDTGSSHTIINSSTGTAITFVQLTGTTIIDGSINTSPASTGYVDIILNIPPLAHIQVSSFQIVSTDTITTEQGFIELSSARQIDHLFNYYKPLLEFKPISSYLVGWEFSTNPAQLGESQTIVAGTPAYIWDQTIANASTANYSVARNTASGGLQLTTTAASGVYIMQYLSGNDVKQFIFNPLSVNVNAYATTSDVNMKIYLFRAPNATAFPVLPTSIGTVALDGTFTRSAAGWTEIPRGQQGLATANLTMISTESQVLSSDVDYGFSGWQITDNTQLSDTDKFAIVVTFATPTNPTSVVVNSISLVPGLIPTRPAPQAPDEVLRECQYYYEQSYEIGVAPGTNVTTGIRQANANIVINVGGSVDTLYLSSFPLVYNTIKIKNPNVAIYSPSGASDAVRAIIKRNNSAVPVGVGTNPVDVTVSTHWTVLGISNSSLTLACTDTSTAQITTNSASLFDEAIIFYHYTADSRLGM